MRALIYSLVAVVACGGGGGTTGTSGGTNGTSGGTNGTSGGTTGTSGGLTGGIIGTSSGNTSSSGGTTSTTASGGTTATSSGTGSTTGGSGGAIHIVSVTFDPPQLYDHGGVSVTAIVTDSGGLSSIAGGTLSAAGVTLGSFSTAGGQGTFMMKLGWFDLVGAVSVNQNSGDPYPLTLTFFDNAGNQTETQATVPLVCTFMGENAICSSYCTDLTIDPNNCGACGAAVPAGQQCNGGAGGCRASETYCAAEGACADLGTSASHCGSCGNDCNAHYVQEGFAGEVVSCSSGQCCIDGECGAQGECDACRKWVTCEPTWHTCEQNSECKAIADCVDACGSDINCANNCAATAPPSVQDEYSKWYTCLCTSCSNVCSHPFC